MAQSGTGTIEVDSKVVLVDVLGHMKQQNSHQVSQLERGDAILRKLQSTNRRINVLVGAAVITIVLAALHERKIDSIVLEQRNAQVRSASLEKSVDMKITTGTENVVRKVEELGQTSPRVVTGSDGTLSLSVPVTIDTSVPPTLPPPKPAMRLGGGVRKSVESSTGSTSDRRAVIKGLSGEHDHVLLPLE